MLRGRLGEPRLPIAGSRFCEPAKQGDTRPTRRSARRGHARGAHAQTERRLRDTVQREASAECSNCRSGGGGQD
eukprot:3602966-Prymnesium_polylepis.2